MAGIAAMALWIMHRWYTDSMQAKEREIKDNREDKAMLITALNDNSTALARMTEAVGHLETAVFDITRGRIVTPGDD